MSLKINYNVSAMIANNSLKLNDNKLTTSLGRLSSGYKINSAKDDAAGLAISRRMNAQLKGLRAASQDAKDGVSVVEIADGALAEVHDILQRMNELSIKSANGTLSDDDRTAIQQEISQLGEEIDRIGQTTEYNSQKLFTGEFDLKGYTDKLAVKVDNYSDAVKYGEYAFNIGGFTFKEDKNGDYLIEEYMGDKSKKVDVTRPDDKIEEYKVSGDIYHLTYKGDNGDEFTLDISGYGYKNALQNGEDKIRAASDDIDENYMTFTSKTGYPKYEYSTPRYSGENFDTAVADAEAKIAAVSFGTAPTQETGYPQVIEYYEDGTTPKVVIDQYKGSATEISNTTGTYDQDIVQTVTIEYDTDGTTEKNRTTLTTTSTTYTSADKKYKVTVSNGEKVTTNPAETTNHQVKTLSTLRTVTDVQEGKISKGDPTDPADYILEDSDGNRYSRNTEKITTIVYDENGNEENKTVLSNVTTTYFDNTTKQEVTLNEEIESVKEAGLEERTRVLSSERTLKTKQLDLTDAADKEEAAIKIDFTGYGAMTFQVGANEGQTLDIRFEKLSMETLGFKYQDSDQTKDMCLNVGTANGALKAIDQITAAIGQVSAMRSRLGAMQNRLEHTDANLATSDENMTAAYSRIMDTDMAEEMSNYSNLQIVSQAATAILAQANERPSQMLQLLQ